MQNILSIALNPAIDISSTAHRVQHTHKVRTHGQTQFAGGGGVNVARVIGELGGRAELAYLSGGDTGLLLDHMLAGMPITKRPVKIAEPVRIAFMVQEEETGLEYRFVPEGPLVSAAEAKPVFDLVAHSDAEIVIASGSLPRGLDPDSYARMAAVAGGRGAKFIVDTSGDALHMTLTKARVFLVKPSLSELESFVGHALTHDSAGAAAMEIVKSGAARYVAVTLGGDGALLASESGVLQVPAIKVDVQSAVGAGDSFVGALAFALAEGRSIEDAFRFGLAAGAAAVMTTGTELCRRADVLRLYGQI